MPASAQILEVRPDGSTQTYARPVTTLLDGIHPLTAPRTAEHPVTAGIRDAAHRHRLSPQLVAAVAWQESHGRQDAVSAAGALGVMQLMPATAKSLGVDAGDPASNIEGGTAYLAHLLNRFDGDIIKSLAAYNAGPEAVARHGGMPPYAETRAYVNGVLDRLANVGTGVEP